MATSERYLVKDATTGKQIYTRYGGRPKPFAFRKTRNCPVKWDTVRSLWSGGDLDRAKAMLSKTYGKPVVLEPAGVAETINIL